MKSTRAEALPGRELLERDPYFAGLRLGAARRHRWGRIVLLLRDQLKRVIQGIASEIAKGLNPESVPSPFKGRLNCSGGL
jgi:hypothetical protein